MPANLWDRLPLRTKGELLEKVAVIQSIFESLGYRLPEQDKVEELAKYSYEKWKQVTDYVYDYPWEEQPETIKNEHRMIAREILSIIDKEQLKGE